MNNKVQIIKNIGIDLLDLRYKYKTDKLLAKDAESALSLWTQYAEHYDNVSDYFESTIIAENPFLRRSHLRTFYKKYLAFIDKSADYALEFSKNEIIRGEETIIAKYETITTNYLSQFSDIKDEFAGIKPLLLEFQDFVKNKVTDITEYHKEKRSELDKPFYFFLHNFLDRFHTILSKCESPLEEAFFIGLVAFEPFHDFWIFEENFDSQVKVGNYRLDFAYVNREKSILLAIELDGHNYHERSEEQAVKDRQRDIFLQQEGWYVLRFHRREIEEDLESCINRVKKFYDMKVSQLEQIQKPK